jgi:hypothetical protein
MNLIQLFQLLCFFVFVAAFFASLIYNNPLEFMAIQIICLLVIVITDKFDIIVQKRCRDGYMLVDTHETNNIEILTTSTEA